LNSYEKITVLEDFNMSSKLIQDIQKEKDKLIQLVSNIPSSVLSDKIIDGTGGKISIYELIAYQIGWGKCLIRWYEMGIKGQSPEMPGDGFLRWNYKAIAKHFYHEYQCSSLHQQILIFEQIVLRIVAIIQTESETANLEQIGVWPWCTLPSGKQWPLSKWIRVNTAAPYKRAVQLIKKGYYDPDHHQNHL
jgi:hypothetical protein